MSATKWWRSELEIQAAANGFASTGEWYMTATPSSSPDELFYGKKCLFISSRNHDFPDCDSLELVARVRPFRLMTLLVLRKCCVAPTEGCVFWLVFRFLYKQLLLFFDADPKAKENCIFESSADSHQLQLKPEFSLHLYANRCPEGAAKNPSFKYASWIFLFLCI